MKYFSEVTKSVYDTEEELIKAEESVAKEQEKKEIAKQERAERAKEIEEAIKDAAEAQKKVGELIDEFVAEYGSYHTTIKDTNFRPFTSPFFDFLLKW